MALTLSWIRLSLSAFAALGSWLAALFCYMRLRLAVLTVLAAHRTIGCWTAEKRLTRG
jgi:hypothetical protein